MIIHNSKGSKKIYSLNAFYSYLQDLFDEPKYMKYEIPIEAKPGSDRHPAKSQPKARLDSAKRADPPLAEKIQYFLINGWTIDEKSLKYLKDGTLES